ncbi:MAG: hypothetical protein QOE55_6421 [Acidobacteriaceae bacterium]|nr:hypothetical protein [Acidobacteriaceae bacterium]
MWSSLNWKTRPPSAAWPRKFHRSSSPEGWGLVRPVPETSIVGCRSHAARMGRPGAVRESPFTGSKFIDQVPSDRLSRRSFKVKLLTALSDPPLLCLTAAFACLLRTVATATINLCAAPNCWIRFEKTYEEFEDVNRGCYADKCIDHCESSPPLLIADRTTVPIKSAMTHPTLV